jgi:hypothetical protein
MTMIAGFNTQQKIIKFDGVVGSSVASLGARPRRTAIATVSNSVKQCKIATVNKGFFLYTPGEGPCSLGPGYATGSGY